MKLQRRMFTLCLCPHSLKGAQWFSTVDLASGYWQMEFAKEEIAKTAFCTKYGLFQFNVMPFGLGKCDKASTKH